MNPINQYSLWIRNCLNSDKNIRIDQPLRDKIFFIFDFFKNQEISKEHLSEQIECGNKYWFSKIEQSDIHVKIREIIKLQLIANACGLEVILLETNLKRKRIYEDPECNQSQTPLHQKRVSPCAVDHFSYLFLNLPYQKSDEQIAPPQKPMEEYINSAAFKQVKKDIEQLDVKERVEIVLEKLQEKNQLKSASIKMGCPPLWLSRVKTGEIEIKKEDLEKLEIIASQELKKKVNLTNLSRALLSEEPSLETVNFVEIPSSQKGPEDTSSVRRKRPAKDELFFNNQTLTTDSCNIL